MDAAVAALAGAAIGSTIGAAGVIGASWLQQRHQTRRDIAKTAADLAIADFGHEIGLAKERGGTLPPMSAYVAYHAAILRSIADGKLGPETLRAIYAEQDALLVAIHETDRGPVKKG